VIWTLLTTREPLVGTALYGLCALLFIIFDEAFVLWAVTSPARGGLGFDTTKIGIAQSVSGAESSVALIGTARYSTAVQWGMYDLPR
jgi:hypothetical protein